MSPRARSKSHYDFVVADLAGGQDNGTPPAPTSPIEPQNTVHLGDEITFGWPAYGVTLSFGPLHESSDGIHGECSVVSSVLGEVHWARLNLSSSPAREGVVRKLEQAVPGLPWRQILERACRDAARALRQGEPVAPLVPRLTAESTRFLVPKLLLADETNLLFADGGSGKSLVALALASAVATGAPLSAGLTPSAHGALLLLDWESHRDEHEDRLARLLDGLDIALATAPILYRRMGRALADEVAPLRVEIARHQVSFVVVDSFASACRAEPETADSAIRLLNGLRALGPCTRLLLAHVTKAAADARGGASRAFGSVFVQNLARNCWEFRRADHDGGTDLVLALFHRKMNAGPLSAPLGLRFEFRGSMTTLHGHDNNMSLKVQLASQGLRPLAVLKNPGVEAGIYAAKTLDGRRAPSPRTDQDDALAPVADAVG